MQTAYSQSKKWLSSLPMRMAGFDLGNITRLVKASGLKIGKLKAVHVAGSNGKGSTCAFIERILREEGYKTGMYTSPHLIGETERIQISGTKISRKKFAQLTSHYKTLMGKQKIAANYFEVLTAMAFKHFLDEKVDIAVIETGMGGRLDATNILNGIVTVFTSISLEHTQYLGSTIEKIAAEKAGIIKKGSVVVVAENNAGRKTIKAQAKKRKAKVTSCAWSIKKSTAAQQTFDLAKPTGLRSLKIKMLGRHQCENASLAAAAAISLRQKGFMVTEKSIRSGLEKAFWPGRMHVLRRNPLVIADAAHNPDGWKKAFASLKVFDYNKLIVVFGAMKDKDTGKARGLLAKADTLILTRARVERAEDAEKLGKRIGRGIICGSTKEAIKLAIRKANAKDIVLVTGSASVAGEALKSLNENI